MRSYSVRISSLVRYVPYLASSLRRTTGNHLTRRGGPLTVPGGSLWSVAFSPDSRTLAATTDGGVATLWDLDVESAISRICAGSSGALTRQQWSRYVVPLPYDPPCAATR